MGEWKYSVGQKVKIYYNRDKLYPLYRRFFSPHGVFGIDEDVLKSLNNKVFKIRNQTIYEFSVIGSIISYKLSGLGENVFDYSFPEWLLEQEQEQLEFDFE
jgi:hypothetical protein